MNWLRSRFFPARRGTFVVGRFVRLSDSPGFRTQENDIVPVLQSPTFGRTRSRFVPAACLLLGALCWLLSQSVPNVWADHIRDLQTRAVTENRSEVAHWGPDAENYTAWGSHSNRLIPVITYGTRGGGNGVELRSYTGPNSPYRSEAALKRLYGRVPPDTLNPAAEYGDQTNVADIQRAALEAGRKHIILVVFDGMDWQTLRAAAIHHSGRVGYDSGRGSGLHLLDYTAEGTSEFGWVVTSPFGSGGRADVDKQQLSPNAGTVGGGYNAERGGPTPWQPGSDPLYIIGKSPDGKGRHAYPDSAATATAMTTGVKTLNGAINVDPQGNQLTTIAHLAQRRGYAVGAISSVPISHATPAAAYAHNVRRSDYQDLTRDLVGLKSVAHPQQPLPGLDVLIGGGYGVVKLSDRGQGSNFVPGNAYIAADDLAAIDVRRGGKYVVVTSQAGQDGDLALLRAAEKARADGKRLFGMFGIGRYGGHLPFRTADGDYQPAPGRRKLAEVYTPGEIRQNPTLATMTEAALRVLGGNPRGFWLMVEAGDVDWANHDNNLDTSIGAVLDGDAAIRVITDWVERHSNWKETIVIITADHGHYLVLEKPQGLLAPETGEAPSAKTKRPAKAAR